jgi:hypothetical protein
MTNDELVKLGVWVIETLGEAAEEGEVAMSYATLDNLAVAQGVMPPGVRLTKTPEFAKIKEAFLEHHAVH